MFYKSIVSLMLMLLVASATATEDASENQLLKWTNVGGAKLGYSLESLLAIPDDQFDTFKDLFRFCAEQIDCQLLDVALEEYPLVISDSDDSMEPLVSETIEATPSPSEGSDSENPRGSRLRRGLAGLPDKHNWTNHETRKCANEGERCHCYGNVVYTKRYPLGCVFGCRTMDWSTVVSQRLNSNRIYNVRSGIDCTNGAFGGDPWEGHKKQCFCHPHQEIKTRLEYLQKWSPAQCHSTCGKPGSFEGFLKGFRCGFSCTGGCTASAISFATGRSNTFPIVGSFGQRCMEHCYCVGKGWTG
jgi:hypothetical protein